MPFKVFAVNEILTASDVNEYFMDQTVMTFAGTAERGTAIGTAVEGMITYLEDTDQLEVYGGTAVGWTSASNFLFGTATPAEGSYLTYSTAVSAYEPSVGGTPSYRYVDTLYYTSNSTFTKASYPWLRAIRVKVQGAGGGGGNRFDVASNATGGGGGGGGYAESFLTDIASLSASITVTVGAGGAGGASGSRNDGADGGDSSFGSLVIGEGSDGTGVNALAGGLANGGTGDLVVFGSDGSNGNSAVSTGAGHGGNSRLGGGGRSGRANVNAAGYYGGQYGGGGGGSNGDNVAGNGADGIVIVELYA